MLVKFSEGKTGPITQVEGKISFPERRGLLPNPGELWEVEITGQNKKGSVNFLKLITLYQSVEQDPSLWGLPKREWRHYYDRRRQVHIEYALTKTEVNELLKAQAAEKQKRIVEATKLEQRITEIKVAEANRKDQLTQIIIPIAEQFNKTPDTVMFWVERAIDMGDISNNKVAINEWCQNRWK